MPKGVPNRKRKTAGSINKRAAAWPLALLLNRISRILRVNHFLRKKIMYHIQKVFRGKLETRIFFNEQGHSVFAVG